MKFRNFFRKSEKMKAHDFSKMSDKELLECFKESNWQRLRQSSVKSGFDANGREIVVQDNDKLISLLQELENREATKQGRQPERIIETRDPTINGSQDKTSHEIHINIEQSYENHRGVYVDNPSGVLATYYHEQGHAIQHHEIVNGPKTIDQQTLDVVKVETAIDEREGLYNYEENDYNKYRVQACEMTSNTYSQKRMLENKQVFKGDNSYNNVISTHEHYLKVDRVFLDNNREMLRDEINEKAQKAFDRQHISEEELKRIEKQMASMEKESWYKNSADVEQQKGSKIELSQENREEDGITEQLELDDDRSR